MIAARQIMWSPWTGPGLEHLRLSQSQEGIVADSVILGVDEQGPFRIHYAIHCDANWRLRAVHLDSLDNAAQSLHLFTDGAGAWTTERGEALPFAKGVPGCRYYGYSIYQHAANSQAGFATGLFCGAAHGVYFSASDAGRGH